MPRFRIKWQGHPDITNKVEKDVKLKQTNKDILHELITNILEKHFFH